jgi:translation initiation factor IF-1
MSREFVSFEGSITSASGGGVYAVTLDSGKTVTARLCGKMRKFRIRVLVGDRVTVGVSPYDLSHGLITERQRTQPAGGPVGHHNGGRRR